MPTDYEKVYQEQRDALGQPTKVFVDFFDTYDKSNAKVLDIGCGQGRDALHIARHGHHVVGIDISPTGIKHLLEDAEAEQLSIEGIVADLNDYQIEGQFDVIVVDRTLHMLSEKARLQVVMQIINATNRNSHVLIADQKSNLPSIKACFDDASSHWETTKSMRGYLFLKRAS